MILHFQFSIKYKVILPPPLYKYSSCASDCVSIVIFNCLISSNARYARCLFIFCVIVYNLYYCCYRQKLVLQRSKNVTAKCTENLSPPPCILYSLVKRVFVKKKNTNIYQNLISFSFIFFLFNSEISALGYIFRESSICRYKIIISFCLFVCLYVRS